MPHQQHLTSFWSLFSVCLFTILGEARTDFFLNFVDFAFAVHFFETRTAFFLDREILNGPSLLLVLLSLSSPITLLAAFFFARKTRPFPLSFGIGDVLGGTLAGDRLYEPP